MAAAGLAACAPTTQTWTFGPPPAAGSPAPGVSPSATAAAEHVHGPRAVALGLGGSRWPDARRLDRPRHRRPRRRPPLHREPRAGAAGDLPRADLHQARGHPRGRGQLPTAHGQALVRAGPAALPQRRAAAGDPRARWRRQGLQDDDRRDRAAGRRADAADRGPRLQRPVARSDHPGQPGRPRPSRVHQQPEGNHRGPLPRGRVRGLLHGRRPVRQSSCRSSPARRSRTSSGRSTRAP